MKQTSPCFFWILTLGSDYPPGAQINDGGRPQSRFAVLVRPVISKYFNLFAENAALCMRAYFGK